MFALFVIVVAGDDFVSFRAEAAEILIEARDDLVLVRNVPEAQAQNVRSARGLLIRRTAVSERCMRLRNHDRGSCKPEDQHRPNSKLSSHGFNLAEWF